MGWAKDSVGFEVQENQPWRQHGLTKDEWETHCRDYNEWSDQQQWGDEQDE